MHPDPDAPTDRGPIYARIASIFIIICSLFCNTLPIDSFTNAAVESESHGNDRSCKKRNPKKRIPSRVPPIQTWSENESITMRPTARIRQTAHRIENCNG